MVESATDAVLHGLRNTRDLRAEILSLAAQLVHESHATGRLIVAQPVISEATIRKEWDTLLPAIAEEIRTRMVLQIDSAALVLGGRTGDASAVLLERPNYRFEVMRLLLDADLDGRGPQSIKSLIEHIGASQTPVRAALAELKQTSGVVHAHGRGVEVRAEDVSIELLAKLGALPQRLRFRFERGARIKPATELLRRADALLGPEAPVAWKPFALSGAALANLDAPGLDLVDVPRLDLVAHVPRDEKHFDAEVMRQLDDGLELEHNVVAPAPLVITLVRADRASVRKDESSQRRNARKADVFLSLLELGLRAQAVQYAKAVRV